MKLSRIVISLIVVLVVATAVGFYIGSRPSQSGLTEEQKFDAAMAQFPSFTVLKEQEPEYWSKLRGRALAMQKEGKTEQQIIDVIQPEILQIQIARLQSAPDDQVVRYMKVNMEQTAAIQKVSDDDCYRFLFPNVKGGINPMRVLSKEMLTYRATVDADMMRSAYGAGKHTATPQEHERAQQDLQPIAEKLMQKYGADVAILSEPQKGVGKEKLTCDMVEEMWSNVLALPADKAAGIVRFMMAQ
jgi:hypothetical protein